MKEPPNLILAFAFSLLPDGSPGSYNEILARQLNEHIKQSYKQNEKLPLIALQWEIADALTDQYPHLAETLNTQQKLFVIEPPRFRSSEVDEDRIESWLGSNAGKNGQLLLDCLGHIKDGSVLSRLNKLLDNGNLFKDFQGIKFDNLTRPELGQLFTERRVIPSASQYPNGLRRFQRIRVNRLIIESIVHDRGVLKTGRYLSTPGVIDSVLDYRISSNQQFSVAHITAHPLHSPRCSKQTSDAFMAQSLDIKIMDNRVNEEFPWDSDSAQIWCQSFSNWNRYETAVQDWMSKRSS